RVTVEHPAGVPPVHHKQAPPTVEPVRTIVQEANRLMQDRFSPPGVLVDQDLQILQFRGQTGAFLEPSPGEPSVGLLKMVREGLLHGVRAAIAEARRTWSPARRERIRAKANGGWREANVNVFPLGVATQPHFLVVFEDVRNVVRAPAPRGKRERSPRGARDRDAEAR